jgi:hypothetical protein
MKRVHELDALGYRAVTQLFEARKHELAIVNPELSAFILCSAIEAIVHRAVLVAPEFLRDPRLVDEACALVTRYLGVADG